MPTHPFIFYLHLKVLNVLERKAENVNTWTDNKVCELATMSLPWQHWTKALVWFDDVDITAFHSCIVVDLWQSLSEWHFYCLRVFWCAATRMSELELEQRTNIKFLVVS